ncbi:hypothetical protein [Flavobacterium cerinum]|uniref:GLPGLI family protein n=1 Tax=Flavobacterium cerinum TaxID=2502784 RepID=A0A3S3Q9E2_9FLAO|nr:hypothetical protein [Flavobacterium cerinum]RWX00881.1 hypothetical protein EPI11_07615 [Flavobacterium cerinum]
MKNFLLLCGLLLYSVSFAQTLTEKWNSYNKQYEYFNSNNQMIGYKKYDSYTKSWLYYDVKPQVYEPKSNINLELTQQVLASKQQRYNYNKSLVQNAVNEMYKVIDETESSQESAKAIKSILNRDYISKLNSMQIDFSNDVTTDNIVSWLWDGFKKVLEIE